MGTVNIPMAKSDYFRGVAKEARILTRNRFFEKNPVLNPKENALIARPALKLLVNIDSESKTRGLFSSSGTFDDDAFAVMGNNLRRLSRTGVLTDLGTLSNNGGAASLTITGNIGSNPEKLFVADGGVLLCYNVNGYATGTLNVSGPLANLEVIRIGDVYYRMTTGSVNAGTPLGTAANPWQVLVGGSTGVSVNNLYKAIGNTGIPGTTYSTALVEHPLVTAASWSVAQIKVNAKSHGAAGNLIVTTETGVNLVWVAATLTGGGGTTLTQIPTPEDVGILAVAQIGGYVIVIPVQGAGVNGRFYWIEPGAITIDALNFATAERSPDGILQVVVFSDMFWLCGNTTTEPWILSGNELAPMQRFQGILFDRGTWGGTAVQVKDSLILTDTDGAVFQIQGGLKRVSTPQIEARIKASIDYQALVS